MHSATQSVAGGPRGAAVSLGHSLSPLWHAQGGLHMEAGFPHGQGSTELMLFLILGQCGEGRDRHRYIYVYIYIEREIFSATLQAKLLSCSDRIRSHACV